ncbi:MAG: purine-nucleoside phosphorylase [Bacteroidetes bacterium CG2_30_33_31]|nr:MAG: purine-nucleoside phosphorylase [Bacteroidetes bacterium CG2_30_33_31]
MYEKIQETVNYILKQHHSNAKIGIVLGSGLGNLANHISVEKVISYKDIPNFPVSTVKGHKGMLIFGKLGGKEIIAMQGRLHFYEGYTMNEVSLPIRVLKSLGIETVILSNAAGGMNPNFKIGDIMLINDHISLFPQNPLLGKNDERLGARFPDMSEVYSKKIISIAKVVALKSEISVKEGVYVGTTGPTFETPAEYRYFRIIGGDAVGMSTVPEAIVAHHAGMKCFAVSIITDLGIAGQVIKVSHQEVLEAAMAAEPKLTTIITGIIELL